MCIILSPWKEGHHFKSDIPQKFTQGIALTLILICVALGLSFLNLQSRQKHRETKSLILQPMSSTKVWISYNIISFTDAGLPADSEMSMSQLKLKPGSGDLGLSSSSVENATTVWFGWWLVTVWKQLVFGGISLCNHVLVQGGGGVLSSRAVLSSCCVFSFFFSMIDKRHMPLQNFISTGIFINLSLGCSKELWVHKRLAGLRFDRLTSQIFEIRM